MKSKFFKSKLLALIFVGFLLEKAFCLLLYQLPLENPTDLPLPAETTFKKGRKHPILNIIRPHNGLDFNSKLRTDDPIYAAMEGKIEYIGNDPDGWGWHIVINHGNNIFTLYAHLNANPEIDPGIKPKEEILSCQLIGRAGTSGLSTGVHLHFELRICSDNWLTATPVDPLPHLLYWEKTKPEIITVSLLPPGESNLLGLWVARDPNAKYGQQGYVSAGQTLNYTVEFENEGEGIA